MKTPNEDYQIGRLPGFEKFFLEETVLRLLKIVQPSKWYSDGWGATYSSVPAIKFVRTVHRSWSTIEATEYVDQIKVKHNIFKYWGEHPAHLQKL